MPIVVRSALVALMIIVTGHVGPAKARGPLFIAEAQLGYTTGGVFAEQPNGFGGKLTFGLGGKFSGFPVRLYGVLKLGLGAFEGSVRTSLHYSDTTRSWFGWSAGARALIPLGPIGFVMDVGLGTAAVKSTAELNGGRESLQTSDSAFLIEFGGGLQYRFVRYLSVGVRLDVDFPVGLESFDFLAEASGVRSSEAGAANLSVLATITVHL